MHSLPLKSIHQWFFFFSSEYLSTGQYVDISLVCRGQVLRAHKVKEDYTTAYLSLFFQVVLSSSSKYFKDFFRHQPGVNIIDLDKVTRETESQKKQKPKCLLSIGAGSQWHQPDLRGCAADHWHPLLRWHCRNLTSKDRDSSHQCPGIGLYLHQNKKPTCSF